MVSHLLKLPLFLSGAIYTLCLLLPQPHDEGGVKRGGLALLLGAELLRDLLRLELKGSRLLLFVLLHKALGQLGWAKVHSDFCSWDQLLLLEREFIG